MVRGGRLVAASQDAGIDLAGRDRISIHRPPPRVHYFYKPTVSRVAAHAYGYHLTYASRPSWEVYQQIQSFLWVLGSSEYPD